MVKRTPLVLVSILLALVLGTLAAALPIAAQQTAGPKLTVNATEIEISGRVQTQFNTTTVEGEPPSEFLLRRVRLEVAVKISDLVSGEIQPDFAGERVSVKDAFLKLTFSPAVAVLVGQAFRPFSLLEQTSSRRMLPIERGAAIRGIDALDENELVSDLDYGGRDLGLQVRGAPTGAPLGLEYAAGIFRGPLQGRVGPESTHQLAARISVAPFSRTRVGAGWSARHFSREISDGFELKRGSAWEVDLEYGSFEPGIHFLGEVAFGGFEPFADASFSGAQAWLGYRTQPLGKIIAGVEPILRASHGAVSGTVAAPEEHGGTLLTPGLNVYLGGWNRLMVNYDVWLPNGSRATDGSFKAQFQLVF